MTEASIIKQKDKFYLKWSDELCREISAHSSLKEAKDAYYIQIAYDYMGASIRNNSVEEKISIGKRIEKYGVDENGNIM